MRTDYKKLQNGSDIRGVALEGVEGESVNLGAEEAHRLTSGFITWLMEKTKKPKSELKISVGRDSRLSGEALQKSILGTLHKMGVESLDCEMASTPAMFMSIVFEEYRCDGAIMITASHLPFNRNGFKYFDAEGGLNKSDISKIIAYAESDEIVMDAMRKEEPSRETPEPKKTPLIDTYAAHLRRMICENVGAATGAATGAAVDAAVGTAVGIAADGAKPLAGLKIVVDAGNGAGGFYAEKVLAPLGADVSGSRFLEPDGTFPNHQPNPENKAAMESICKRVLECGADLGIIFDTDVDRSSAVDSKGREVSRNAIVAMAAVLVAEDHPNTTVVTDSITSDQLTTYLEQGLGLKHMRFKRGYKNVINKAIELNSEGIDSQLAIETSGHAAFKENYFLDDGAYLATKIVIKAAKLKAEGRAIDSLLDGLEEPKEAMEKRYPISAKDFAAYADQVLEELTVWANQCQCEGKGVSIVQPNYEGVRLNFKMDDFEGWCLLRKSLHDPLMPLNVEVTKGSCKDILKIVEDVLGKYDMLVLG